MLYYAVIYGIFISVFALTFPGHHSITSVSISNARVGLRGLIWRSPQGSEGPGKREFSPGTVFLSSLQTILRHYELTWTEKPDAIAAAMFWWLATGASCLARRDCLSRPKSSPGPGDVQPGSQLTPLTSVITSSNCFLLARGIHQQLIDQHLKMTDRWNVNLISNTHTNIWNINHRLIN